MGKESPCVVITGGGGYVGSAIARELKKRGWKVYSLSRNPGQTGIKCDVRDKESVKNAISRVVSVETTIEACIHAAAAPLERIDMRDVPPEAFDDAFAVNVRGALNLSEAALPHMEKGSSFIGITTAAIESASPGKLGAYPAAKSALRSFLRGLSHDPCYRGIRVYAVAPGFLPGGLNNDIPKAARDLLASKDPYASVEHIASVVADLCTEAKAYKSGTSIDRAGKMSPL